MAFMGHFVPLCTIAIKESSMNIFEKAYCRTYQFILNKIGMPLLAIKNPPLIEGEGSIKQIASYLREKGFYRPFVLVSPNLLQSECYKSLSESLSESNYNPIFYSEIVPNPTFSCVLGAKAAFVKGNCDSIIALGGGSVMDTAKAVGAMVANKIENPEKLKGLLKVHKRFSMLIAIPSTAGTGSETTLAAVLVNEKTKDKFSINDPNIIPNLAVLDPIVLKTLPPHIIASTGMDALTHAVEAFIGKARTRKTKSYSIQASRLIFENLEAFYRDPLSQEPREAMLKASYLAGAAFTRSYVGYVHALAHALGGFYNVPHGLANAILLPKLLRVYGKSVYKPLARLSDASLLLPYDASIKEKADSYIAHIEEMNARMGIPKDFKGVIKEGDLGALAKHAAKEANPLYPVPKELSEKELKNILKELC